MLSPVGGAVLAGVGYAAIPDGGGVLSACRLNSNGSLRLIAVGSDRFTSGGKDESLTVGGDRVTRVGKNETLSVDQNRTERVGVKDALTVSADRTEHIGANLQSQTGGSASILGNALTLGGTTCQPAARVGDQVSSVQILTDSGSVCIGG